MSVLHTPDLGSPAAALPPSTGAVLLLAALRRYLLAKNLPGMFDGIRRLLSIALDVPAHRRLVKVLNGEHIRGIFLQMPRLAYRYTLPCLSNNFQRAVRLELLIAHYRFMSSRLGSEFCAGIIHGNLMPWGREQAGHWFSIRLSGPCAVSGHREGELTFTLQMDHIDLYKLSFSIVPASVLSQPSGTHPVRPGHTLYIGRVQGVPGNFEQIRLATKACHDIAPPDLLMSAVAGMARALGIEVIGGVGIEHSISSESIQQSSMSFDYTEFWDRYHGIKAPDGHHLMSLPFPEKPIQDIAAKHRKRTLVKREFKQEITEAAEACVSNIATGL